MAARPLGALRAVRRAALVCWLAWAALASPAWADRESRPDSGPGAPDGQWAWWRPVAPADSPFGPYDPYAERIFRLEAPDPGGARSRNPGGSAGSAPAGGPGRLEVLVRTAVLYFTGHRSTGAAEGVWSEAEPFLHDGAWHVRIGAGRPATLDLVGRLETGAGVAVAQTRFSLYPPPAAAGGKGGERPAAPPPPWPTARLERPASPQFRVACGQNLALVAEPGSGSGPGPAFGAATVLDRGAFARVAEGSSGRLEYAVPDDPLLNRAGPMAGKEVVLMARLGPAAPGREPSGREGRADGPPPGPGDAPAAAGPARAAAPTPVAWTFSFEVFRNPALHSSRTGAVVTLLLAAAVSAVAVVLHRRRSDLAD